MSYADSQCCPAGSSPSSIGSLTCLLLPTFLSCLTLPVFHPVFWDSSPAACTCVLVAGSTSGETQAKRILLGTCHLGKLDLPDHLGGDTGQALQNGMALGPKGLFGAKIRFRDQPKLLENSLIILESQGGGGSLFPAFICI